jgi:hypothetical protein
MQLNKPQSIHTLAACDLSIWLVKNPVQLQAIAITLFETSDACYKNLPYNLSFT